ncbi:DUF3209 family protein [Natronomonas pharaonis DSM 2160]|uniref:DUF3209 family protein n=1 Tax=Natronomonas pharaonis (strain ATCC 35678 / DSM 2160 / CIP 103997 / JCM 8858 / NBRC 14720 / NCIMB 2260 / Gabara) TaxID=348780 RepID=A0A1U7EUI5_NATPD|nr:DUF3209 family protein [Natronomonas pharaonis]CAI48644.1 DUF3209 family protein [Natronomonas pharaonis DSM 2160]
MSCHEIEALRLGLMNSLGIGDDATRRHARDELGDDPEPHIAALADAESLAACRRHLDTALVELEAEIAEADPEAPDYDYLRGRLVAVRDAENALERLLSHGDAFLDDLGESHHTLHEAFPVDE